jgi:hypothetical protein
LIALALVTLSEKGAPALGAGGVAGRQQPLVDELVARGGGGHAVAGKGRSAPIQRVKQVAAARKMATGDMSPQRYQPDGKLRSSDLHVKANDM